MKFRICLNNLCKNKVERVVYQQRPMERFKDSLADAGTAAVDTLSVGMRLSSRIFSMLAGGVNKGLDWVDNRVGDKPVPHPRVPTQLVDPNLPPNNWQERSDAKKILKLWETEYRKDAIDFDPILTPFAQVFGVFEQINANNLNTIKGNNEQITQLESRKARLRAQNGEESLHQQELKKIKDNVKKEIVTIYTLLHGLQLEWEAAKSERDAALARKDYDTADAREADMKRLRIQFDETQKGIDIAIASGQTAKSKLAIQSPAMQEMNRIDTQIVGFRKTNSDVASKKYKFKSPEVMAAIKNAKTNSGAQFNEKDFDIVQLLFDYDKISREQADALDNTEGTAAEMIQVMSPYKKALETAKKEALGEATKCVKRYSELEK